MALPAVLITIDENSRIHVAQDPGVLVAMIDWRVDAHLVALPVLPLDLTTAVASVKLISIGHDDLPRTAGDFVQRLVDGEIVAAGFGNG